MKRGAVIASAFACATLLVWGMIKYWNHQIACHIVFDGSYEYSAPRVTPAKFRVYILSGMDGATNVLKVPLLRSWADGITAAGGDVVVPFTPYPKWCRFRKGGAPYRLAFLENFSIVIKEANRVHGAPSKQIVSGISFGGLHAIIAFTANPGTFTGWQASMPVTKLNAMAEFARVGEIPRFDAFTEAAKLRGTNGFLAWRQVDPRVNSDLTRQFYKQIRSPRLVGKEYPGVGHGAVPGSVQDLIEDARRQTGL